MFWSENFRLLSRDEPNQGMGVGDAANNSNKNNDSNIFGIIMDKIYCWRIGATAVHWLWGNFVYLNGATGVTRSLSVRITSRRRRCGYQWWLFIYFVDGLKVTWRELQHDDSLNYTWT